MPPHHPAGHSIGEAFHGCNGDIACWLWCLWHARARPLAGCLWSTSWTTMLQWQGNVWRVKGLVIVSGSSGAGCYAQVRGRRRLDLHSRARRFSTPFQMDNKVLGCFFFVEIALSSSFMNKKCAVMLKIIMKCVVSWMKCAVYRWNCRCMDEKCRFMDRNVLIMDENCSVVVGR